VGDQVHERLHVQCIKTQLLDDVISSGGEPLLAYERAIRETLFIVVQKIDDNIGKFQG
jgi:hypothetical protein